MALVKHLWHLPVFHLCSIKTGSGHKTLILLIRSYYVAMFVYIYIYIYLFCQRLAITYVAILAAKVIDD